MATSLLLTSPSTAAALAAALTAALPHTHASAAATSRAHAGLRTCLLVLRPKLISRRICILLPGLNLVLVGRSAWPHRRPTAPLASSLPHARLRPAFGGNEKAENTNQCY
ncbi:MAG: hypothetical protein ACYDIC_02070 [Desulfobaccales bacterium]